MALNNVNLTGRLVADPISKTAKTKNGDMMVCQFTLANDKRGKDAGTNFFDCMAWGKTAESITKYFKKGEPILVSGRLDQSSYEKDGQKRSSVKVVVDEFCFMGGKSDKPADNEKAGNGKIEFGDIPF